MEQNNQTTRPPIVVVLGHIDHGKSSLLEAIKDFKITAKESGGITQHIGAYQVKENDKTITFLDTPGHEAFSQMRSRGAKVADIAILVIDAAEGVKVQTKEAISHIKHSEVALIVALNKIDKPGANPEKVKRELMQEGVEVESMGGKVPAIEISAITKKGIPELLDMINLIAEMSEFKADAQMPGKGVVIESYLDNFRGPTATLLLLEGNLNTGDIVGTKTSFVKIKSLENFQKIAIEKALPSDPVILFGFNQAPMVGEEFKVFPDTESAKSFLEPIGEKTPEVLEVADNQKVLNLILKTDVLGSAEALDEILKKLPQDKVILRTLTRQAGNINESDVKLAKGGRALILGFRVKADSTAKKIAEREKVRILTFNVIYELVEKLREIMSKTQIAEVVRKDLGRLKVLAHFFAEKNRQIIGGKVIAGELKRGATIEVLRDEEKVGQGRLINLQKNKKDAALIQKGEECGILFEGDVKIETGDILVFFTQEQIKPEI